MKTDKDSAIKPKRKSKDDILKRKRRTAKARYLKRQSEKAYEDLIYQQIEHLLLQGKTCYAVYKYLKDNNFKSKRGKKLDYRNVYKLVNKNFNK